MKNNKNGLWNSIDPHDHQKQTSSAQQQHKAAKLRTANKYVHKLIKSQLIQQIMNE